MNFKTISVILAVLSLDLLALSSPVNEFTTDAVENTVDNTVENFTHNADQIDFSSDEEIIDVEVFGDDIAIDSSDEEVSTNLNEIENENVCQTKECLEVSNNILNSIDNTVDPCDDFYQFSCGNWIKKNKGSSENTFMSAYNNNIDTFIDILKNDYKPNKSLSEEAQKYDKELFNQLKSYFNSCMDEDKINEKREKPVLDFIKQLKIDENKENFNDTDELTRTLVNIHKYGIFPLFSLDISLNEDYNVDISFDKGSFISFDDFVKPLVYNIFVDQTEEKKDEMIKSVIDFVEKVNGKKSGKFSIELIKDLLENENENNNDITENTETIKEDPKKKYPIKYLMEICPNINWKLYIKEMFEGVDTKTLVNEETEVLILNEPFFVKLNEILKETDAETLSNFFKWSVISNVYQFLSMDIKKPINDVIYSSFDLPAIDTPRDEQCYKKINDMMGYAVGRYFVLNNFKKEKKEYAEKVLEYIKQSLFNRIPQVEWLDNETIEYSYKKLDAMSTIIGYSETFMDPEYLAKNEYNGIDISSDDYFTNEINYKKFMMSTLLSMYDTNLRDYDDIDEPQDINAYYFPLKNLINIPAGILQPPFFSQGIPDYINYGGIGSVIGHELTHAFDFNGKDYDINGDLKQWWTDNDIEEFTENTKCFIDQYNKLYVVDSEGNKHNINGKDTLNENLADNGGLARAYEAWKLSLQEDPEQVKKENQLLPGLSHYSMDQLFFISFAQLYCENEDNYNSFITDHTLEDEHSPGSARVRGVVSNSKVFAKVFNCPVKSAMNPEKKCQVW